MMTDLGPRPQYRLCYDYFAAPFRDKKSHDDILLDDILLFYYLPGASEVASCRHGADRTLSDWHGGYSGWVLLIAVGHSKTAGPLS
jgi:hypothetical protein